MTYTGLFGTRRRVLKSSKIIRALGALDEANSYLGTLKNRKLERIQKDLMTISSILAGAKLKFPGNRVKELERDINKLEKKLPPLRNFILPRGQLMFARALVRRAEREAVGIKARRFILAYLNRLSDYLFLLAREERQ